MLDAARQAIRWTIPGWLLFIFLALFFASDLVVRGPAGVKDPVFQAILEFLVGSQPQVLIAVGAAGVPVGFLLYQLYYWGYWRGFEIERVRPLDKGLYVLRGTGIDTSDMFWDDLQLVDSDDQDKEEEAYSFKKRWNNLTGRGRGARPRTLGRNLLSINNWIELTPLFRTREAADRYRHNWFVAESVWYHTIVKSGRDYLETRAVFMADVYHSLGAARVTLVLAYVMYPLAICILYFRYAPCFSTLPGAAASTSYGLSGVVKTLVANALVSAPIYLMLRSTRRVTRLNLLTLKRHFIVAYRESDTDSTAAHSGSA